MDACVMKCQAPAPTFICLRSNFNITTRTQSREVDGGHAHARAQLHGARPWTQMAYKFVMVMMRRGHLDGPMPSLWMVGWH